MRADQSIRVAPVGARRRRVTLYLSPSASIHHTSFSAQGAHSITAHLRHTAYFPTIHYASSASVRFPFPHLWEGARG